MEDPKEPRLGPLAYLEWHVLECLYDLGSGDAVDVADELRRRKLRVYHPSTTGIFLARVAEKGYLSFTVERQRRGRPRHTYRPAVPREAAIRRLLQHLLDLHALKVEDVQQVIPLLEDGKAEGAEVFDQ